MLLWAASCPYFGKDDIGIQQFTIHERNMKKK
jgi:hypothetical protein